ncbi:hypothetical protein [Solimonas flava]|uniref:hypothetical protein n=1 Tax=Solimonas flava TaxID=415849 RepID=UPI0012B5541B|nr:hypothetical protein [Solimonas flava]
MNIQMHLAGAAVAIAMTVATFGGIDGYAAHVKRVEVAAASQHVAAASVEAQLQRSLRQTQREVRDNVLTNLQAMLPPVSVEVPTLMVIARR